MSSLHFLQNKKKPLNITIIKFCGLLYQERAKGKVMGIIMGFLNCMCRTNRELQLVNFSKYFI